MNIHTYMNIHIHVCLIRRLIHNYKLCNHNET